MRSSQTSEKLSLIHILGRTNLNKRNLGNGFGISEIGLGCGNLSYGYGDPIRLLDVYKRQTPVMIISIACVAVRVPITYLFAMGTGMYQGLYWANKVFNTLFAVGVMLYYHFGKWEHFALTRRSMPTVKEST